MRDGCVYELFLTSVPAQCLHATEVVDLYFQRGGFEQVLSDEDAEQDPDRWCSCTPHGQEFWQIVSQWVWNTRLELGQVADESGLRTTRWQGTASLVAAAAATSQDVPMVEQPLVDPVVEQYGAPEIAGNWGRASGRFSGHAFEVLENGMLRCPAEKLLRPQEHRKQADGTLRVVYRARQEDCRSCALTSKCLGRQASGEHPRRVSTVRKRIVERSGTRSGLLHEDTLTLDVCTAPHEVMWCDLPGYRLRHLYVGRLRRQQVRLVVVHAEALAPAQPVVPRIWTRAERAHRRLTWKARLARNCCRGGSPRFRFTVWGIVPALAAYLGLAPQAPT
ncbi:MAG: hypothetical protein AVDCRST_MAG93-10111 [uncultured Chloroflexia bacterium]|uniref:Uncharacterized protein n=1 Tax=uncultured Chloroflexia bacterium TaxID=1672391 RepID=A0A6J4NVI0_9CHLR|nr:MAG: hypothetical protein AVDCRST_MAG93-10111 [uncultured Chloroflexia bacterium]